MKNLSKIAMMAFVAASFTFASCGETKKAGDATEGAVDAASAEVDSLATPTEGDTAVVLDQPVKDGVVDSTAQH